MVGKEPEVEKKREPEPEFEKQKEKKHTTLKEKEIENIAYKDFETAINKREIQKQEEVKRLKREAAKVERKHIEKIRRGGPGVRKASSCKERSY